MEHSNVKEIMEPSQMWAVTARIDGAPLRDADDGRRAQTYPDEESARLTAAQMVVGGGFADVTVWRAAWEPVDNTEAEAARRERLTALSGTPTAG